MKMNNKAMGLRIMILNVIILMVIIFLMLGFIVNFIGQTNPTSPLLNDNQYKLNSSYNILNAMLNNVSITANSIENQTASSSPDPTSYVFLIFRGAFEVPISMLGFIFGSLTSLQGIFFGLGNSLTFGPLFVTLISLLIAGLTFTLIFLIIKFIRSGESER